MKRKLFLTVIMVLVLCLTCGMLLVACDKDDPVDPTPPPATDEPITVTSADVWPEVQAYLQANNEYALALEIKAKDENGNPTGNPIFGLAFEKIGDEYVMYGNVGSNSYIKLKGFDIIGLIDKIDSLVGTFDIGDLLKGQSVKSLLEMVGAMIWAEDALLYNNNVYDFTFDISGILDLIGPILAEIENIDATVAGFIGVTVEELGSTVQTVADVIGLKYDSTNGIVNGLINAIATLVNTHDISIVIGTGEAVTNDANNPFGGVITGINADLRESAAQNLLKFSVDGTVTGYENQEEGAPVVNHTYTIDVDVDINPFELLAIVDALKPETVGEGEDATTQIKVDMSKEEIIDMIKKVGYIGVQVNEVGADNAVIKNILTLYYDSGDYAVAALQSHPVMGQASLGLGGVYNIDALIDVIGMLTAPAGGASEPQQGSDSGFDFDKIIGIVETVMGYIDLDNIAADGVTIDFAGLVPEIVKLIMPEGNEKAEGAVMDVLGSDSLNIKFGAFNFGKSEKTEAKDLIANLRLGSNEYTNSSLTENHGNYIVDITGAPGLSDGDKIGLGSDITSGMTLSNVGYEGIYLFNGTDIDGNAAVTSGIIMDVIGFDPNTLGEQTVTVYVGVVTDFYFAIETINGLGVLENPIVLDPMWPLFGVLRYDVTIEVVDPMANYEQAMGIGYDLYGTYTGDITSININVGQAWTAGSAEGTWGLPLDGISICIALRTGDDTTTDKILFTAEDMTNPRMIRITDSAGNDITDKVIAANGVINDAGTYTLLLCKGGYGAEIDIIVS